MDLIPAQLLKEVFDSVGQTISLILNSSLATSSVPLSFKHAVVQPILKKPNLDNTALKKNFAPSPSFLFYPKS